VIFENNPIFYYKRSINEKIDFHNSLRFSQDIAYLVEQARKALIEKFKLVSNNDGEIDSKLLELIFSMLTKIFKNYDEYLLPYMKAAKNLSFLEEIFSKTHKTNLERVFELIECFFNGKTFCKVGIFISLSDPEIGEPWNKDLDTKMKQLQVQNKMILIRKIMEIQRIKTKSFKNFELLLYHSLESEGHRITIRKKTIGRLYHLFAENQETLALIKPADQDPIFKLVAKLGDSLKELMKCKQYDKMNIRLKSRLMIHDESMPKQCGTCNVVLTEKYSLPNAGPIVERYKPEDSQSLMSQYCYLLKRCENIPKNEAIEDFFLVRNGKVKGFLETPEPGEKDAAVPIREGPQQILANDRAGG